jgi:mannosyltransferase OCH1-like enzyme
MVQSNLSLHVQKTCYWLNAEAELELVEFAQSSMDTDFASDKTIPHLIHFIWLGLQPIPSSFTESILPGW